MQRETAWPGREHSGLWAGSSVQVLPMEERVRLAGFFLLGFFWSVGGVQRHLLLWAGGDPEEQGAGRWKGLLASREQQPRSWVWERISKGRERKEGARGVMLENRSKQGPSHAADTKR